MQRTSLLSKLLTIFLAISLRHASASDQLASTNAWAEQLNDLVKLAGTNGAQPQLDKLTPVFQDALNSLPFEVGTNWYANVVGRIKCLRELEDQYLPTNHPLLFATRERRLRWALEMKRFRVAAQEVASLVPLAYQDTTNCSGVLRDLITEDYAAYLHLIRHFDAESHFLEDLLYRPSDRGAADEISLQRWANLLGESYRQLGKNTQILNEKALGLFRISSESALQLYGPNSLQYASVADNLARFLLDSGELRESVRLAELSHRIRSQQLQPSHADLARSQCTMAMVRQAEGRLDESLNFWDSAFPVMQLSFGPTHPEVVQCFESKALINLWGKHTNEAKIFARETIGRKKIDVLEILTNPEEKYRQSAINRMSLLQLPANLAQFEPGLLEDALRGFKGVVSRSLFETAQLSMALTNQSAKADAERWVTLRDQFIELATANEYPDKSQQLRAATAALNEVEAKLNKLGFAVGIVRHALFDTVDRASDECPPDTAIVDYFFYFDAPTFDLRGTRLDALLHLPGRQTRYLRLKSLGNLKSLLTAYPRAMKAVKGRDYSAEETEQILTQLNDVLFDPVRHQLPEGVTNIVISAEGPIGVVSFASLISAKRLLGEDFRFRYVPSVGDTDRRVSQVARPKTAVVFGAPNFDLGVDQSAPHQGRLHELPGTFGEAHAVEEAATRQGWSASLYLSNNASKVTLAKINSPGLLIIGTHGFFAPTKPLFAELDQNEEFYSESMASSVLALAGANKRVQLAGTPPPKRLLGGFELGRGTYTASPVPDPEGFVSAQEIEAMRLPTTSLVILSACVTGMGVYSANEGMFGFERAFMTTGARNLLVAAWPVDDNYSKKFIPRVAEDFIKYGSPAKALTEYQAAELTRLRNQAGLLRAAQLAGPYMLVSREY